MAARILNDVLNGKISYANLNIWLTGKKEKIESLPEFQEVGCNPGEFILYFLNLLRDQTISILQPCQHNATPRKGSNVEAASTSQNTSVGKPIQGIRTELFPPLEKGDASPDNCVNNSSNKKKVALIQAFANSSLNGDGASESDITSPFMQSPPTAYEPTLPLEFHNKGSPGAHIERDGNSHKKRQGNSHKKFWHPAYFSPVSPAPSFFNKDYASTTIFNTQATNVHNPVHHSGDKGKDPRNFTRRINPTRLFYNSTEMTNHNMTGVGFETVARSREPGKPFQEQVTPVEGASSSNFAEERDLLRKERMRLQQNTIPLKEDVRSRAKVLACKPTEAPEPSKVDGREWLDAMARVYSLLLDANLTLNLNSELCFIVGLLVMPMPCVPVTKASPVKHSTPVKCCEAQAIKVDPLNSIHNCVYFSVTVLNLQRHLLALLDTATIRLLSENTRVTLFHSELHGHTVQLLRDRSGVAGSAMARGTPTQPNVVFQIDTDNRCNFPSDHTFHTFRKQRDGLYELLRVWESSRMSAGWSFAVALSMRARALIGLHDNPANFVHFARLFRSQLVATCQGGPSQEDGSLEEGAITFLRSLREVDPQKLSRLKERLVAPCSTNGGPRPSPAFPGPQEFFRDFILAVGHARFNSHLVDSLSHEVMALNDTPYNRPEMEDSGRETSPDWMLRRPCPPWT